MVGIRKLSDINFKLQGIVTSISFIVQALLDRIETWRSISIQDILNQERI